MKFKYFLRGLGVGIIFSALVCLVAYSQNIPQQMSDAEIIEKAKELGMVERENHLKDLLDKTEQTDEENAVSTENGIRTEADETKEVSTESQTTENIEQRAETTQAASSEKSANEESTDETVTITVDKGASSYPICQKLKAAGLIEDVQEFDAYLIKNGYASKIRVGKHVLKKGMDYHEIAEALSEPT